MKTSIHFAAPLVALSFVTASAASAQTTSKPPEQLGTVSFANSCAPDVQASLQRAVALLHSFWFSESEKTFRDVLERDPACAIATWGIATNIIGNTFSEGPLPAQAKQAQEVLERGRAIGAKTERERYFIAAIGEYYDRYGDRTPQQRMKSLSNAFELVAKRFPSDDEAQIFSAVYLTATQSPDDKTFAAALKAAAILEVLFKKHPDHPGVAHYLIHSYDYPPIAAKGLNAAKRYAEIAPSAPHALHMPSHIFTRVGAWQDSARSNERSAAVAKAAKEPARMEAAALIAMISRRTFLHALPVAVLGLPIAEAQQPGKVARVGYLHAGNYVPIKGMGLDALRPGLRDLGWIEGRTVIIESRFAGQQAETLSAYTRELVQIPVDILVTVGTAATRAAKTATSTIPIVMFPVGDPVEAGLSPASGGPGATSPASRSTTSTSRPSACRSSRRPSRTRGGSGWSSTRRVRSSRASKSRRRTRPPRSWV